MNHPDRKLLVYFDTSNHFDAMKGKLDLEPLRGRAHVTVVFSDAHFNDAGGGGSRGFEEMDRYIKTWPNSLFVASPEGIPALELFQFAATWPAPPAQAPDVIFGTEDGLRGLLGARDDSPEIRATTSDELDTRLQGNEEVKRLMARGMTFSKQAAVKRSVPVRPPSFEETARGLIAAVDAMDEDAKELWRHGAESDDQPPSVLAAYSEPEQVALWSDLFSTQRAIQRATVARDVAAVARLIESQQGLVPRMEADPFFGPILLATKSEGERWSSFQVNCVGLGGSVIAELGAARIRALYDAMVARPALCPAWTLLANVGARMKRDAGTPAKPSDRADLNHLALFSYVDVIFVDSRIHTYVMQAKEIAAADKAKCKLASSVGAWVRDLHKQIASSVP